MFKTTLYLLSVTLFLSACEDDLDKQHAKLLSFFKNNKTGSGADYVVMKDNFSQNEPVIAVFGFIDDLGVCQKIVDSLNEKEPGSYRCAPMNI